jgi:hypothetical protein
MQVEPFKGIRKGCIRRDTHFAIDIEQRLVNETQTGIPFNVEEYLALVDWTDCIIRRNNPVATHPQSASPSVRYRIMTTY